MRGNVYISIPAADKDNALPSAITRYDWNEYTYDDEGEVETTQHSASNVVAVRRKVQSGFWCGRIG